MPNLVIVSNRLPVSVKKVDGKLEFFPSTGGLATGLSSYTNKLGTKWIGWPGIPSDGLTEADRAHVARELRKQRCYPVFLTQQQIDEFYSGFSNSVLWPLMHDLPVDPTPPGTWQAYKAVNEQYADEVLRLSSAGSTVWVHDYQLMLMPEMIRRAGRKDRIGFFLHIPFPAAKVLTQISQAKVLLHGLLGADLIGFHTRRYAEQFMSDCEELLGTLRDRDRLLVGKRSVRVTEFPMGIDYTRFEQATKLPANRLNAAKLRRKYRGQKIIVSVDRLDLTKGLVERITAYQTLLRQNPDLLGKVVLVMIVAPSRTDVPAYKKLKLQLDETLESIRDEFETPKWKPVDFIYEVVPLDRVMTYYQMADVAFIAPIIDGMNLVAKEFIASKKDNDGVLVLSETAGAAEELRDAIRVNPAKPQTMVRGLKQAINLPQRELQRRAKTMQKHIREFTVQKWAESFMDNLQRPLPIKPPLPKTLTATRTTRLVKDYAKASKRLLLLDYDGVLRAFETDPAAAKPSAVVTRLLRKLGSDPKNDLMIVSGRSRDDLGTWFGDLPIGLAAEHGALIRRKAGKNWHHTSSSGLEWRREVIDLFEYFAAETPGALVEQKEWAVVWHYRAAKPYYAQKNLVALRRLLRPAVKRYGLRLLEGNKVLEVRPSDVNKRRAAQEWLVHDHDFILCIGDDVTDEDMFTAVPAGSYSIKVGGGQTAANYRLKNVDEVIKLLGRL
ncbi:MAG: bifunctional alpha,alpha-trehalose-phosphate synthase (UDP-forming)/trehalose-phosphatase [Candidatus Saccharibacteria bacterium]